MWYKYGVKLTTNEGLKIADVDETAVINLMLNGNGPVIVGMATVNNEAALLGLKMASLDWNMVAVDNGKCIGLKMAAVDGEYGEAIMELTWSRNGPDNWEMAAVNWEMASFVGSMIVRS